MKRIDPLYFPRNELAERLLISLKEGITHALTLFAPRRMGKTQFLLNDIEPKAEAMGFNVFYFSFMDQTESYPIRHSFTMALVKFLDEITQGKSKIINTLKNIKSIDLLGVGVELNEQSATQHISISQILDEMAIKNGKPILMLLDEVQELSRAKGNEGLIRSLRTGLDVNQSAIKVIFTGSSTNGLKAMFSDNKAPFFHFAYSLDFPHLDRAFTDFLADMYHKRTGKPLNTDEFYQLFVRLHFTPSYMRAITQDMIINPNLSLDEAAQYRLSQINEQGDMVNQWKSLSALERHLLLLIANGNGTPYSKETRQKLAEQLGIDEISTSTIQGKLRKLERNELITRGIDKSLQINSTHFKTWITENALAYYV